MNLLLLARGPETQLDRDIMWCLAIPLFVVGLIALIWPWMVNRRDQPEWMVRLQGLGTMGAVVVWIYVQISPLVVAWFQ